MIQTIEEVKRDLADALTDRRGIPPANNDEWLVGTIGNFWEGKMLCGTRNPFPEDGEPLVATFGNETGWSPLMLVQKLAPNLYFNLIGESQSRVCEFEWDDDWVVIASGFSRIIGMEIQGLPVLPTPESNKSEAD